MGGQGNPHLHYDTNGTINSIWVDDEQNSNDLSVYELTSGSYPTGAWLKTTLPTKINTASAESQPFFTGSKLYFRRGEKIVYHNYLGVGSGDFGSNSSWGDEVTVLEGGGVSVGNIWGVGEPTIANVGGKNYLYFIYVVVRSNGLGASRYDFNTEVGFVEIL